MLDIFVLFCIYLREKAITITSTTTGIVVTIAPGVTVTEIVGTITNAITVTTTLAAVAGITVTSAILTTTTVASAATAGGSFPFKTIF